MDVRPLPSLARPATFTGEAAQVLSDYLDELDRAHEEGPLPFRRAFEASPPGVGVHEIDTGARVLRVNRAEQRLLGYTAEEMIGRAVWEIVVMQEASRRAIEQKLCGERPLKPFVRSFRRKDGTAIALLLADRYLKDARGQVIGLRTAMIEIRAEGEPTA
jgi:two-component system, NtrC family, sensor kinase